MLQRIGRRSWQSTWRTPHSTPDSREAASHQKQIERRVQEFLLATVPPLPGDYYLPLAATAKGIVRLPERKVLEPDGIPTIAIKQLPRRVVVTMTRLFNGILRTGYFPGSWMMGRVISLPKAGKDTRLASSQHPIKLLFHIAKLFLRIMVRHLYRHLTPRQE
ncbi:Probable RNA-directed DNA polymerase from transposon X-element [Eumeta japonica]|uniref:Probable RNA-directed DNA polymerase from transposon X-element n=1 Tax=Eumeta variegata TaxID=151549 RepID=A0A4C1VB96_EUMVA|nr:Probable RNA-directed DNA polymerase from transposon X-element [Eumeta japonica]